MKYLLNSLAVFRLTYMLMYDLLPFQIMAQVRDLVGVRHTEKGQAYATNELGKVFLCEWCMSLWLGLLFAKGNIREALAYSGVTAILFKMIE